MDFLLSEIAKKDKQLKDSNVMVICLFFSNRLQDLDENWMG